MFGGRLSHTKFSLRDMVELEVKVSVFFVETTKSLISLGENTPVEHNFRCSIGNETTLTRGVRLTNAFTENIKSVVNAVKDYSFSIECNETVSNETQLSSDISIAHDFHENVVNHSFMGLDTLVIAKYIEVINSDIAIGKNTPLEANMREAVFGKLNIEIVDKDMIVVTVSIPPNGELRIDSDNFTVTLNGENIIHQHSGDWVNIMRESIDMIVLTGGGSLEGQLLYLERFL